MGIVSVPVAIVTGTIGVGKSTIAGAMSEILHEEGIRHALIEVDSLGEVYPAPDPDDPYSNDLAMEMLAALWPQYLAAGIARAVVTMTLENQTELNDLVSALGSPPATVVRLVASEGTRRARIEAREHGNLRVPFLDKTGPLASQMECLRIGDVVVDNDDRHPHETATEILTAIDW